MSSTIDRSASSVEMPSNGQAASRIIHFDATRRRKDKMRQTAQRQKPSEPTVDDNCDEASSALVAAAQTISTAQTSLEQSSDSPGPTVHQTPAPATESTGSKATLSGAELEEFLVNFVVEQTGYPPEMVEMDIDLEADLGIDSIKKAQLFGELTEHFDVAVESSDELSLDDFPTLRHVMKFLEGTTPTRPMETGSVPRNDTTSGASSVAVSAATDPSNETAVAPFSASLVQDSSPATLVSEILSSAELEEFLVDFVVEQTGYPPEMVEMDADLEADLGIDSIKKAQLFGELAEHFEVDLQSSDELSLDDFPTLRHVLSFLEGAGQKRSNAVESTSVVKVAIPLTQTSSVSAAGEPATAVTAEISTEPAVAVLSGTDLEDFLINFVVEQTGYPPEMVEMDADLEADLGIDSIKKAQLFGELAERFEVDLQSSDELSLDDYPTLRDVRNFLEGVPQKVTV